MKKRKLFFIFTILGLVWCVQFDGKMFAQASSPDPGATTILKWKDGKRAAFLLEFDDSVPTDIKVVIPELVRRGMVGTFYLNPGNAAFKAYRSQWESMIPKTGMVYANHTFTHVGAKNPGQLDDELSRCSQELDVCFSDVKKPRLISFGRPGGVPWTVTPEEQNAALAKYHLIERPSFKSCQTKEQMLALVDQALATGETEYNVFHGVGGDWLPTPVETFNALLDKLEANRTQLWITDPISWHQYSVERRDSTVKVLEASRDHLRLSLRCSADATLYDLPITLATQVPSTWKACLVTQHDAHTRVPVINGEVRYSAVPGPDEILIQPVSDP